MTLPKRPAGLLFAFALPAAVALVYAAYTQHAWEDYYITYRASRNLATGHGLVFNVGDRLHTFTSPLGVLLPAVASLLTGNTSDPAALWIFRGMCITALGGAAVLLVLAGRRLRFAVPAAAFIVAGLALDAKIVDFTINGMETAFMLLFLAYAVWAHLSPGPRQWLHLGAAWAGLMWTRPDSFIYVGLIAAGFWLFPDPAPEAPGRKKTLGLFFRAGAVTAALYLPWLLFAQFYYGTAVPHTITAKSGIGDPHTLTGLLKAVAHLPLQGWDGNGSLRGTFLPAYYMMGGWPEVLAPVSGALGMVCALLWPLPCLRRETRVGSLAFFGAHAYLSYFPYFPFPWYLPSTTLLGVFTLGSLLNQALPAAAGAASRWGRGTLLGCAALLLAGSSWITWQTAHQFRAQQQYIEEGNRRKIGEWLRANSQPGDSVFLEPLGYIGFYSGLKTYDFPGMSSREMVHARRLVGNDWLELIEFLQPTWLVLRLPEASWIHERQPNLLEDFYHLARVFNVTGEVEALDIRGRPYLEHDARFAVYHLQRPIVRQTKAGEAHSQFDVSTRVVEGTPVTLVHAPGTMAIPVPATARVFSVLYGFPAEAYTGPKPWTDGAFFQVEWEADGQVVTLLNLRVDPVNNPDHRGLHRLRVDLPATRDPGAHLVLRTMSGGTTIKDWTCWGPPEFDQVK